MTNLLPRFTEFSKDIILACKGIKQTPITRPIISQLVRSASSIGANYAEAQSGISRKDFRAKIFICLKEADEAKYWLELLETAADKKVKELNILQTEAGEICKILQSIASKIS